MVAKIDILGKITNDTFISVVSQFKKYKDPASVEVMIDSPGGLVSSGESIYEFLKSLKIPVVTIAKGTCASIAVDVFLAGETRKVYEGTEFMIHNPWIKDASGEAKDFEAISKGLTELENKQNKFLSEALSLPIEAIAPLTRQETELTTEQLLALGFATEIIRDEQLIINKYRESIMREKQNNREVKGMLQEILSGIRTFSKNFNPNKLLELTDADGIVLSFPDLEPDQMPSVGDAVVAEDGEYTLSSGVVIKVTGGVVSEIVEPTTEEETVVAPESEEIVALKQENYELRKTLAEMKSQKEAQALKLVEFEGKLNKVKSMIPDFEPYSEKREKSVPVQVRGFKYKHGLISNLKK